MVLSCSQIDERAASVVKPPHRLDDSHSVRKQSKSQPEL
jgi:hypothetical protein